MKKHLFTLLLLMYMSLFPYAQGVFKNNTNESLSRVISDYPNGFKNIRGAVINHEAGKVEYHSRVIVENALDCYIRSCPVNSNSSDQWECLISESTGFREAVQKFRELFDQISKTIVKPDGEKPYILGGHYTKPEEMASSTVIGFQLLPSIGSLKNLKVELRLENNEDLWRIFLIVHD